MTDSRAFAAPLGERQLFLDDHGIACITHLVRTMHQPEKKGAVIRPNVDRGEAVLQTRSAPAWDLEAGLFKLWMITSAAHSGTTYAESEDGLHWRKPALRQREVNGSLDNNFVTLDPRLEWPANAMENVVYDPDDPDPSRRFKGFAHCFNREPRSLGSEAVWPDHGVRPSVCASPCETGASTHTGWRHRRRS